MMLEQTSKIISVIVPVYNGERFLAEAIASITRQSYDNLEIIVVDDGSSDNTARLAKSFSDVHYTYQDNQGPPVARNTGLKLASGDFIAFLDADDLWPPDKLSLQLSLMKLYPGTEIIIGRKRVEKLEQKFGQNNALNGSADQIIRALNLSAGLFRRSVFDKVGFFDESLRHCDDWDWFMRAREKNISMCLHTQTMLIQRRHANNLTNDVRQGNAYALQMLKLSMDRRRDKNNLASLPPLADYEIK